MKNGITVFVDTKSQGAGQTFPVGHINMSQVHSMNSMTDHGAKGGYLVLFRNINKIVFFNCETLRTAETGLLWEKGIYLGTLENLNLEKLFETNT